jgi:hypothetical protein
MQALVAGEAVIVSMGTRVMRGPKDTPLFEWPSGWLKLEVASLFNAPEYLVMTDDEKRKTLLPVTDGEMREFVAIRREINAANRASNCRRQTIGPDDRIFASGQAGTF